MKPGTVFERIFRHPAPMRRLDDYLLKNYPQVWRLRVHYVLIYWLLAGVALFIAGYSMPVDFYQFSKNPDIYEMNANVVMVFVALTGLLSFFGWRNKLSGIQHTSGHRWHFTLSELALYSICLATIILSVLVFPMGLGLKKQKLYDKAAAVFRSDFFRTHYYFYPAYIPCYDTSKYTMPDTYFRHGEALFRIVLQEHFEPGVSRYKTVGRYTSSLASILEAEGMTQEGFRIDPAQEETMMDSIHFQKDIPAHLQNDYMKDIDDIPYLAAGLTFGECHRFLKRSLDTFSFSEAEISTLNRSGTFTFNYDGDTIIAGQSYKLVFFPQMGESRKNFLYKNLFNSLDEQERGSYYRYLSVLWQYNTFDKEGLMYGYHSLDSAEFEILLNKYFSYEKNKKADIMKSLAAFSTFKHALDSTSSVWYNLYISPQEKYKSKYRARLLRSIDLLDDSGYIIEDSWHEFELPPMNAVEDSVSMINRLLFQQRKKLIADALRVQHPAPADSLRFFEADRSYKYANHISDFFYDRYLDYYLKKHSLSAIDSLQQYLTPLGYDIQATGNPRENNIRGRLLYNAFDFSVIFNGMNRYKVMYEDQFSRWIIALLSIYLAVLLFFFTHTNVVVIMRSFVIITLSSAIALLLAEVLSAKVLFRYIELFFISGISAIVTIILLAILRYRLPALAMLAQVQIVLSFVVIFFLNPAKALELPYDHIAYQNCELYVLAYWCILLITIAILYRRHQTLPEKA